MRRLVLVFALVACEAKKDVPSASNSSSPVAGATNAPMSACGDEIVGEEGIGQLRIGTPVESLRQKCNVVRDTTVVGAEGMPARKVAVAFSRDTVEAEIVGGKVWRIAVTSPRLRTRDAVGVGTTIGRLRQLKDPRGMMGEGQLFVASPQHCGMSFRLAGAGPRGQSGDLDRAGLFRLPEMTMVSQILVFGCHLGRP
ncbi:MAG TPA: hypothetical protein VGO33_13120 [Gemmatimonadaceae bacterium]|jgi:hypothetical protein|nr:hypothetical protein [Gemmatimonadaceae bacterium]